METQPVSAASLLSELQLSASRSGGPGGQNVNKVNSKIMLKFDIVHSQILSAEQKVHLQSKLASRLTTEGVLIITSQDKRSQLENKDAVIEKLDQVLKKAFARKKARKATKPSKSSVQERIKRKKQQGEKKQWRKKLDD